MGKTLDAIHFKIHSLRDYCKRQNYSPTIFEQEINKMIAEVYADSCDECKQTCEKLKYIPIQPAKQSWIGGLFK